MPMNPRPMTDPAAVIAEAISAQAAMGLFAPPHRYVVLLKQLLPSIPYPNITIGHPIPRSRIIAWERAALAASYPTCANCSRPINRGHWHDSLEFCARCLMEANQ